MPKKAFAATLLAGASTLSFAGPSAPQAPAPATAAPNMGAMQACLVEKMKVGAPPQELNKCMAGMTKNTPPPALPTQAERDANLKNTTNKQYGFIETQLSMPGIDAQVCTSALTTYNVLHTQTGDTEQSKKARETIKAKCGL